MRIETTVLDTALLRLLLAIAPWTQQERAEQQRLYAAVCEQCAGAWQAAAVTFTEDDGFTIKENAGGSSVTLDLELRDLRLMATWFAGVRVEPQAIGRLLARAIENLLLKTLPGWIKRAQTEEMLKKMPPDMRAALAREAKAAENAGAHGGLPDEEAKT
jgi:hypothetical protein